jgi:dephospho-CoA kinase
VIASDNSLDRRSLSRLVFSDPDALASLNKIAHKYILAKTRELLRDFDNRGYYAAVVDAPVLFESGFDSECDVTACVVSSEERRIARIIERDHISREIAVARLDAQNSDAYISARTDFVIVNDGDSETTERDIDRVVAAVAGKE